MEQHLIISDIAARTGIEAHVLRYWEKELELEIPRNELGHRYYLESHVDMFLKIQELKQAGYQLKAIKNAIDTNDSLDKLDQFALILKSILNSVIEEHEEESFEKLVSGVSDKVIKQLDYLFKMQEELENERFKKLDENIREKQKRKRLFHRN